MKHKSLIALSIAAAISGTAYAANTTATEQTLEEIKIENQQLRDRLTAIEKMLAKQAHSQQTAPQPAAKTEQASKVSHGTLKSKTGDSKFEVNGRIMFDLDSFDGTHNVSNNGDTGTQNEIRRSRIAVTSQLNKEWKAKIQVDYNDAKAEASLKDAYIQRKGEVATLTVGKHHEPMGLEELTSSKYISTIERAMVTDAFAPSRNMGVSLKGGNKNFMWAGGVFESGTDSENDNDQTYAFTGRLVYAPINEKGNLLHFGAAASLRDLGGQDFKVNARAEVHTADKIIKSATTAADDMTIFGLEAATVQGAFSAQAEYYSADISAEIGEDTDYDGYYIMGSYFLTGESRPYKNGSFGKIKPNLDTGAWELVGRYSALNASDNGTGIDAENFSLGLNYYLNANMRFMANYITTDLDANEILAEDSGDALSVRLQYIF